MSSHHHSRHSDPRRLHPAIGTDGADLFEARGASPGFSAEGPANDADGWDVDEAIEQIVSDDCTTCPLCRAIVDRDGNVVNGGPLIAGPAPHHKRKGR